MRLSVRWRARRPCARQFLCLLRGIGIIHIAAKECKTFALIRIQKTAQCTKGVVQLQIESSGGKICKHVFLRVVEPQIGVGIGLFDVALKCGAAQHSDLEPLRAFWGQFKGCAFLCDETRWGKVLFFREINALFAIFGDRH